jgi:hypothetical protein
MMGNSNQDSREDGVAHRQTQVSPSNAVSQLLLIAETNFIIGFALEQSRDFRSILDLVTINDTVTLALPELGFKEARSTLNLNLIQTRHTLEETRGILRQIGRSEYIREDVQNLRTALTAVISQLRTRAEMISQILDDLSQHCLTTPYTPDAMARARLRYIAKEPPFLQTDCDLYESILEFARNQTDAYDQVIFLTLEREDFDHDEIRDELADLGVDLVFTTGECIAMVRYALGLSS